MKRNGWKIGALALLAVLATGAANAQQFPVGEWGDAPEGALAYPATGVIGNFPTCLNPAPYIYHGPLCWAFFGPGCDFEVDGNAGTCLFPPYDQDECFMDGDAGLMYPNPYTIVNGQTVPCQGQATALGVTCAMANWGVDLDITVTNTMPVIGYFNLLIDWDQNGSWGGAIPCPNGLLPEHCVVDFPVPIGFSGPISILGPNAFQIGPLLGHVWSRFMISESPVGSNWNGAALREDGETEDYLLFVDDSVPREETSWGTLKTMYR